MKRMDNKKDSSRTFTLDNQKTISNSCHCYSEEDLLSPQLSKCNHRYFSGIAQTSKLVCDSCNEIIGEWKFHLSYDVKKSFPQSQYLIYKIHPYLRRLTVEEVQALI